MSWRERSISFLRLIAGLAFLACSLAIFHPAIDALSGGRLQSIGPWLGSTKASRGFVVSATSVPPGGRLFVNGEDRGSTPSLLNVACAEGQEVAFRVVKEGYPAWERTVQCREGGSLKIRATLNP